MKGDKIKKAPLQSPERGHPKNRFILNPIQGIISMKPRPAHGSVDLGIRMHRHREIQIRGEDCITATQM